MKRLVLPHPPSRIPHPGLRLILLAIGVSGCNLVGGKCTYELRSFDGQGSGTIGTTAVATAQVNLSEQRGSIVRQTFSWLVTGSLKGHVTSAAFKDATNPDQVLLDLPVLGPDRTSILEGTADSRQGATIAGFHDILASGHGGIELKTDDPASPTVIIPITQVNSSGWVRPYCS
ncbi:MAG TPA: hypothetical protein VJ865_11515 [Gemmatimonadaceae bacterium]|nr:hypothetical protein [Gemmatimonadaceae bacterium]